MAGDDFTIKGKVDIDDSAVDKTSRKFELLQKDISQQTSKAATSLDEMFNAMARVSSMNIGFDGTVLSKEFMKAVSGAHELQNAIESLDGSERALLATANKVANELGGKNYENLSSQIDRFKSSSTRTTFQMDTGGVGVNLSDREKQLAIVASMTAKAAAEDAKLARQEQILAGNMREVAQGFDQAQKDRQAYMQTTYRQQATSVFTQGMISSEAAAMQKVLKTLKLDTVFQSGEDELLKLANHLPRIRYALYDVAASATGVGVAFSAMAIAPLAFAVKAERAFADVVRTSKVSEDGIAGLRQQFVDLQQTIPESFSELTKIGSLGGQLNIATESLASFTKTVAMFSATTNVNVQDAATAFGRLDQLINGINGRYEQLGSSILAVGVNSVATESQIIAIAQQIASIANLSKFSADQVIGLSGALASVGTSPELSRGLVTRLFGNIQSAIASGGEELKKFGAVSNESAADFKQGWQTSAASQLIQFLKGIDEDGTNAEATLRDLGIASIRDIPSILKLAQNWKEVANSLKIARDGFVDNTELQKQYGIITRTIADRVQILSNNFQALITTVGESSSAFGPLIDLISDVLRYFTDLAQNPFGQAISVISLAIAGLVGSLGLLVGAFAFGGARLTAFVQATLDGAQASGLLKESFRANDMTLREYTKTIGGAVAGSRLLKSVLMTTAITAVVTVGLTAISAAAVAIGDSMKSAGEKARKFFKDIDVTQAIKADTEAFRSGADSLTTFTVKQNESANIISERKQAIMGATEAEKAFQAEIDKTTKSTEIQTMAMGENYAQVLAGQFASDVMSKDNENSAQQLLRKLFEDPKLAESFKSTGLTALDVVTTTIEQGLPAAQAKINAAFAQLKILAPETRGIDATDPSSQMTQQSEQAQGAQAAFEQLALATQNLTEEQKANIAFEQAMGTYMEESASAAELATDKLKEYKDAVESAFVDTNSVSDFAASFQQLAEGIGQGGDSFNEWTSAGRTNIANFQDTIANAIRSGDAMGLTATESVAMVFAALQAKGIDTANLLAQVSNISGVNGGQIQGLIDSGKFDQMSSDFLSVADSADELGSSVGGAAEKVRTLKDYATDLENVWSRAFDIRFSSMETLDEITSSFRKIEEATADARQEISDLNADISKLSSDKSLKEYFLRVAEAYGDTLRAAQLRSEIADIDNDLAKKSKDLSKAQDKTNKTLIGSSDAAIENRAEILGLVKSYQDHIKALASSGMSQEQLAVATEQLRMDFMTQATQLGYNSAELGVYATAFDDVSYAIGNVPRDITVEVDANPAITALNEIAAAGSRSAGSIQRSFDGLNLNPDPVQIAFKMPSYDAFMEMQQYIRDVTGDSQFRIALPGGQGGQVFADGGYTGAGGKYQPAGIVHKGEYVVPREQVNQKTGLPHFMGQPRSFAGGGYVGAPQAQMVYLSPEDRAILRSVGGSGEVVLYANNEAIARSANAGNRQIVATGGRP